MKPSVFRRSAAVVCALLAAILYTAVLVPAIVYRVSTGDYSISLIGAPDIYLLPTLWLSIIPAACLIFSAVLCLCQAIRCRGDRPASRSLTITTCVLLIAALLLFTLIPMQVYAVSLYILARQYPAARYFRQAYYLLGMASLFLSLPDLFHRSRQRG